MNKSADIKELAEALSKVKYGEIGRTKSVSVASKRTGATYRFQYAPLEDIMSAIRRPLADHGLALSQSVEAGTLETMLMHSSGQWLSASVPMAVPDGASPQEVGSAITYARRYGVTLVCCLAADEDDDANIAEGNEVKKEAEKKAGHETPGQIVDLTLAMDGMPPEIANALRLEAKKIEGDFYTIGANAALGSWNSFKASAGEQEIEACWKLIDSKTRSGIKKQGSAE